MDTPRKVYYIVFEDHYSDNFDWVDTSDLKPPKPQLVHAVGFLLNQTEEMVQVCLLSDMEDGQISGVMNILWNGIREIYELKIE